MDLLSKMSTYVRIIEAGRLASAARQLRISPAAVSRQLTALEAEVGVQLVARTTRSLTVTPDGKNYYERCLRILREVGDAQSVGQRKGIVGALKVSAPVTFGLASVVPMLRQLAGKHPLLRLDIRLEDRVVDLVLEGVDVALRVASAPPISTEIVAHRLYGWNRVLVASPAYLKRHGTPRSPAALARHDALSHSLDVVSENWQLVHGARRERVRVQVRCSSNGGHVLRDLAIDGAGIAMLPTWFVTRELESGELKSVLPGWGSEPVEVHALYRAVHRNEQRVRVLVDHLRAGYSTME